MCDQLLLELQSGRCIRCKACDLKNVRSALLSFKLLMLGKFLCPQLGYKKTVKFNKSSP